MVAESVGVRIYLLGLAVGCGIGASAMALAVGYFVVNEIMVLAVAVCALWLVASLHWFGLAVIAFADILILLATGRTVFIPTMMAVGAREAGRLRPGPARRVLISLGFWTNPFMPLLVGTVLVLSRCAPLEGAVSSVLERLYRRRPAYRVAWEIGDGWRSGPPGRRLPLAA